MNTKLLIPILLLVLPLTVHTSEDGLNSGASIGHLGNTKELFSRLKELQIRYRVNLTPGLGETLYYTREDYDAVNAILYDLELKTVTKETKEELWDRFNRPVTVRRVGRWELIRDLDSAMGDLNPNATINGKPGEIVRIMIQVSAKDSATTREDALAKSDQYITRVRKFFYLSPEGAPFGGQNSRLPRYFNTRDNKEWPTVLNYLDAITKIQITFGKKSPDMFFCFVSLRGDDLACNGLSN